VPSLFFHVARRSHFTRPRSLQRTKTGSQSPSRSTPDAKIRSAESPLQSAIEEYAGPLSPRPAQGTKPASEPKASCGITKVTVTKPLPDFGSILPAPSTLTVLVDRLGFGDSEGCRLGVCTISKGTVIEYSKKVPKKRTVVSCRANPSRL
jgi:hypothetical protein